MPKYFKQVTTGLILSSENKEVVEQYEKHDKAYIPCDKDGKELKVTKAPKDADDKDGKE